MFSKNMLYCIKSKHWIKIINYTIEFYYKIFIHDRIRNRNKKKTEIKKIVQNIWDHTGCRVDNEADIVSTYAQRFIYQDLRARLSSYVSLYEKEKEQRNQIDTKRNRYTYARYWLVRNHQANTIEIGSKHAWISSLYIHGIK